MTIVNPLSGESITAFQINQNKFGVAPNIHLSTYTDSSKRRNIYNGFELSTSARLPRRANVLAGWTFEKTQDVTCNSTDNPNTFRFCDQTGTSLLSEPAVSIPYRREIKFNGNLPLWYGVEVSASLRSYSGALKAAAGGLSWSISRGSTRYPSDCAVPGCTPGAIVLPPASRAIRRSRPSWPRRRRGTTPGGTSSTSVSVGRSSSGANTCERR